jgi:hypothetical protein
MLPGFRFLFAAIVFSMSMLVFGLGAAALLRAAHEEFASTPSWRAAPETMFVQQAVATPPMLAMLRVETPAAEPKPSDDVPAVAPAPPAEPVANVPTLAAPEKIALQAVDAAPPEPAKPEIPDAETPTPGEATPALTAAPAPPPASVDETSTTTAAEVLAPANQAAPDVASQQTSTPVEPDADPASVKIATLGGLPVAIEPQRPATAGAEPDKSLKKRQQARRAARRRRIAAQARLAQQAAQQPANPFTPAAATAARPH